MMACKQITPDLSGRATHFRALNGCKCSFWRELMPGHVINTALKCLFAHPATLEHALITENLRYYSETGLSSRTGPDRGYPQVRVDCRVIVKI